MKKKVLFFGCAFHAIIPLLEEFRDDEDFMFIPVIDAARLQPPEFEGGPNPYINLPNLFDSCIVESCTQDDINQLIETYTPDYIFVRCWTKFSEFEIPNSIFWKVESKERQTAYEPPTFIEPLEGTKALLIQNREEVPMYLEHLAIPVGWFPRGVSYRWEKPSKVKTMDIMACGQIAKGNVKKTDSFRLLVKPLCKVLSKDSVHVFQNIGREYIEWAEQNFRPSYFAEEGPELMAKAKIFVSPITTRHDSGILSHKTLQAMACNALVVTQHYPGLEDIVGESGEHLIYVNDSRECIDVVRYYLKHNTERERIAYKGCRFAHLEYNFKRLFKRALNQITFGKSYGGVL